MRLNKGLVTDTRPMDQPAETYAFAKNGLSGNVRNVRENEPGFLLSSVITPYGTPIGVIETDKFPVLLSTNNINSAVWYYDNVNDALIPILDDANLNFKLNFNTANPITGTAQRNYIGQVIIVYTDGTTNVLSYLNCDNPNIKTPSDLLLFPVATPPDITVTTDQGGALAPGSYFAAVRYLKNDGTMTAFLRISDPIVVPGTVGVLQNIALIITLTNTDPTYDIAEVAIVSKVNGIFDQQLMDDVQLSPTTTLTYTGSSPTTAITLEEILRNPAVYNQVQAIGQLNDYLFIGNLMSPQEVAMQQYALMVQLKWGSLQRETFPVDPQVLSGQLTGFFHREVYAFYIQYSLTQGGWSRAFTIPGPSLSPADLAPSTLAAAGGSPNIPKFQVEDTIPDFDFNSRTGDFGKWQNADETYPDTVDFDASSLGGQNLRGKPVRHHRFPSMRWFKQNIYQYDSTYGRSELDILNLQVSSVVIPSAYAPQINGYRILYAQRNSGNSTVVGQFMYLLGGRAQHGYVYDPSVQAEGGPLTNFLSSGGNWFTEDHTTGGEGGIRPIYPDPRILQCHAFDLLLNQPSIQPSYICNELKLKYTNINTTNSYIEDGFVRSPNDGPIVLLLDYLTYGLTPTATLDNLVYRSIASSTYAPNNLINGDWNRTQLETCFGMVMKGPECLHLGTTSNPADDHNSEFSYMKLILHVNQQPGANIPQFENTFLSTLMFLRNDLYAPFTSQTLVIANSGVTGNAAVVISNGGDCHICDYTFHTYGWIDSANDGYTGYNDPTNGMRIARRFSCEAASNINLRFLTAGNQYSDYYPKSPLVAQDQTNYLTLFSRLYDPNQFGYSKDFNALNTLVSAQVFTPFIDTVYQFPYRVHRGGFLDQLDKRRNWRTWDPLDFYEMNKNLGTIQFLDGLDDRLLIHLQKALYLTQDKTQLQSDIIAVTLGAGDIFQFEPQPGMSSKLGYAGNQSRLACLMTPMGYIFVDMAQGQVFQYKGGLKLLNEGMNIFLRDALRVLSTNTYTGNGITLGYDPYYKRVLMTVKNRNLGSVAYPVYQNTAAFIATLTPGVSIVQKDGRLELFLGINNNSAFQCLADPLPTIQNYQITIPDNTPITTQILQAAGVNVDDVYIISGNTASAFALDASTGKLTVASALNFHTIPQYVLNCKATNKEGFFVNFTITVTPTATVRPPVAGNQEVQLLDFSPAGTPVALVNAQDPQGLPLLYTIAAGNTNNAFSINGAGQIVVATQSAIDYSITPTFVLTIAVSNGTYTTDAQVQVDVIFVNTPPSANDVVVTIYDTTPNGTRIVNLETAVVDAGVQAGLATLTFAVVNDGSAGLFSVAPTGPVTVVSNAGFNPSTTPQYIIQMRATDSGNPPLSSLFRLIINIIYDPATLQFAPAGGSCSGSQCPAGWTLSPDASACIMTTSINATPPTGALIQVVAATNGAYANFGALVYNSGYANDGTGTINVQINSFPWNNPSQDLFDGALNRCGVWGAGAIPINTPTGFSIPFTVPTAGTYYIAIAGDNAGEVTVDGNVIITQNPTTMAASIGSQLPVYAGQGIAVAFKFWHIYPVTLAAGNHYIGCQGINFGGAAGFGAEIYQNTVAQLQAAQLNSAFVSNPSSFPPAGNHYSNLNLIFSTRWVIGGFFTAGVGVGYSCPTNYGLDPTQTPPQCIQTQSQAPSATQKMWSQVTVTSTKLSAVIATLTNTPGQTFQGIPVPYYAPVANHTDCGGTVHTFLNVQKQQAAIRNNCADSGVGSTVIYYVQQGRYMDVSQVLADGDAQTDATTNAQAYANANGTCSTDT